MLISEETVFDVENLRDIAGLICQNMIRLNPKAAVTYRPYVHPQFVSRELAGWIKIDLNRLFPNAKKGDCAYVRVALLSQHPTRATFTVRGAKKVRINGRWRDVDTKEAQFTCTIQENNDIVFLCEKKEQGFGVDYMVSYPYYTWQWTSDYIVWVRDTSPIAEYAGEQGFSVSELLHGDVQPEECNLVYPLPSADDAAVDLHLLYKGAKGSFAASYSCAKEAGEIKIAADTAYTTAYVNGKKTDGLSFGVCKGDEIIIVSERNANWGFTCETNELLHLPFVTSARERGLHWLHIGTFESNACPHFDLDSPYKTADGASFWRFTTEDTYLRPYLDTSFFGQWFYGLMVAQYGLLKAGEFDKRYGDYFRESTEILARFYRYMKYDAQVFGDAAFLKRSIHTDNLDAIGTIGMNLYELYVREEDETLKEKIYDALDTLAKDALNNIARMPDDTYSRISVLWADDTYMSCPFLARMGRLTGDRKYFDEVSLQLKSYKEKMFLEDVGVFAHIYYVEEGRNNRVPWGRGNGWVYLAHAEVLEHLPQSHPDRKTLEESFVHAVEGLIALQDENGMWHQVLNMPDSYCETSCTAIFSIALAKGVDLGILDREKYLPIIQNAVTAILKSYVDEQGNVYNVCRGSGCCDDASYYANLGTVLNDAHGTGVVVQAICALVDVLKEDEL